MFALLVLIWSGLVITEQVSMHLLPLTLRHYTASAALIGLVLAINPAFSIIAQPIAGIVTDRIWTPLGRRAVLLVSGAPIVGVCLWFVPEARAFWHLLVLVLAYQFFQDISWGSKNPLLADLVPPQRRTFVMGCMVCAGQCIAFGFLRFGMGPVLATFGEQALYRTAAVAQVLLVAGAAVLVGEGRSLAPRKPPRLTVRGYVHGLLGHPVLRRFCLLAFAQTFLFAICAGFAVLFATQTVGLTTAEFGEAWSWHALTMLLLAVPAGLLVERLHKGRVLTMTYLLATVACVLGLLTHSYAMFAAVSVTLGVCQVFVHVTQRAFFTEHLPPESIGELSGVYSLYLGLGRSTALVCGGWIVAAAGNDYRVLWVVGLLAGAAAAFLAGRLPDERHYRTRPGALT